MPKKDLFEDDDYEDEQPEDEADFTEQELSDFYDLIGDFPELDEIDDILDYDDSDFYGAGEH